MTTGQCLIVTRNSLDIDCCSSWLGHSDYRVNQGDSHLSQVQGQQSGQGSGHCVRYQDNVLDINLCLK